MHSLAVVFEQFVQCIFMCIFLQKQTDMLQLLDNCILLVNTIKFRYIVIHFSFNFPFIYSFFPMFFLF